jgi:hypothetical protein
MFQAIFQVLAASYYWVTNVPWIVENYVRLTENVQLDFLE